MTASTTLFERLLALNAFEGDSAEALRLLHRYLAHEFPECTLSLLRTDTSNPDHARLSGVIDHDGREHMANLDALALQISLPVFADALAARIVRSEGLCTINLDARERDLPLALALLRPCSLLVVPIASAAGTMRVVLGSDRNDRFAGVDPATALTSINLAASLIARPLLTRSLREQSRRQQQSIEGLAEVQRSLLPDAKVIDGLDYAVHWQPAETAAGDYYDLMTFGSVAAGDHTTWGCLIADVSGHGAASAMEAVQFDAILRTYRGSPDDDPAAALTYANRYFFSRRQRQHFLTALAVLCQPSQHRLLYVSAGHPPLLRRHAGTVTLHGAGEQIPLGVLRDHAWSNHEIAAETGDVFVLYTDGVIEARNADGEPFGQQRLLDLVQRGATDAAMLLDEIRAALFMHQDSPIGVDDQTLIVLRLQ